MGKHQQRVTNVDDTEIGYLDGVTSSIQTQLNAKAPLASPTFTGTPAAPTPTAGTNTTQIATTAYVVGQGYAPIASPTFTGTLTTPTIVGTDATDASSSTTGALKTAGGLGVAKKMYVGTDLSVSGNSTLTSDVAVNGVLRDTVTVNKQTGTSYTLVLTDRGKMIETTSSSGVTISIPPNANTGGVAFPVGSRIDVLQTGTGQVTIAGLTGGDTVTVDGTPGFKLRARWSLCTLIKRETNTWVVVGDLAA